MHKIEQHISIAEPYIGVHSMYESNSFGPMTKYYINILCKGDHGIWGSLLSYVLHILFHILKKTFHSHDSNHFPSIQNKTSKKDSFVQKVFAKCSIGQQLLQLVDRCIVRDDLRIIWCNREARPGNHTRRFQLNKIITKRNEWVAKLFFTLE